MSKTEAPLSTVTPEQLKEKAFFASTPSEKRGRPEKYGKYKEVIVAMLKEGHTIKKVCQFLKEKDAAISEGSLSVYIFRNKLNKTAKE